MKKRILSLFLALAMVATAAVVPGTSAEAATAGDKIVSGAVATAAGPETPVEITATDVNEYKYTGDVSGAAVKVGDTLAVKWGSGTKVAATDGSRMKDASNSSLNVVWIAREKDSTDWVKVGEGETVVVDKKYVGGQYNVAFIVPSDNNEDYNTTDKILDELLNNMGGARTVSDGGIIGVTRGNGANVGYGTVKGSWFNLEEATSKSDELTVINNTIMVTTGQATDMGLKFTINNIEERKEYASRDDKMSKSGSFSTDPIIWQLRTHDGTQAPQWVENASATAYDGGTNNAGQDTISKGAIAVAAVNRVYPVYANVVSGSLGTVYDARFTDTNKAFKTNYSVATVNEGVNIYYDWNLDKDDKVKGIPQSSGGYQNLTSDVSYQNVSNSNYQFTLPVATSKTDKDGNNLLYFQGWASSKGSTTAVQNLTQYSRSSKVYYAIWGSAKVDFDNGMPVYRVYNPNSGEHLYTADTNEYTSLIASGWTGEDVKFYGMANDVLMSGTSQPNNQTGAFAVRRLYNANTGEHLYVQDASNEMNTLARLGWTIEANIFVSPAVGAPIYRLWNGVDGVGSHLWTMDTNEVNVLRTQYGWKYEGTPFNSVIR